MGSDCSINLVYYETRFSHDAVTLWRHSKQQALGVEEPYTFQQHVDYLENILTSDFKVMLALSDQDEVADIMASNTDWIEQLYVNIRFQNQGVGSRFVEQAKLNSAGQLCLYTFEINGGARRFYQKHGFRMVGHGKDNPEGLPDLLYQWNREE